MHANVIQSVRTHEAPDYIRVVLDTSKPSKFSVFALENPNRIVIDVKDAKAARGFALQAVKTVTVSSWMQRWPFLRNPSL